jgi:hypothetical protein
MDLSLRTTAQGKAREGRPPAPGRRTPVFRRVLDQNSNLATIWPLRGSCGGVAVGLTYPNPPVGSPSALKVRVESGLLLNMLGDTAKDVSPELSHDLIDRPRAH